MSLLKPEKLQRNIAPALRDISAITNDFIAYLRSRVVNVPHKEIKLFLLKLVDISNILIDKDSSEESRLLTNLTVDVLKLDSKISSLVALEFLVAFMRYLDLNFNRLLHPVILDDESSSGAERISVVVMQLRAIVENLPVPDILSEVGEEITGKLDAPTDDQADATIGITSGACFQDVLSSPDYITHYNARHRDFSSPVVVVLWGNCKPGPSLCHDGIAVVYVHDTILTEADGNQSDESQPLHVKCSFVERDEVNNVIARHQPNLFKQHSNLVAIRSSYIDNKFFIEFVVPCKHFIPVTDNKSLPKTIEGIPTRVTSGWVDLC